ncbi:dTDP-4-dehydrorhamnose reductase [Lacinutrix algicola]|uniref:dTDP-4-dehydrorhamnose reductase n=1 Tax=Lacinutrix algicola TaxID=342954 RepID=UPI0006E2BEB8|nr:dTDP-4-dehydrorhamnose reductase [Lacinutrix algicola]
MKTKILVTGADGQLAKTIKELYVKNSDNLQFDFVNKKELDITNFKEVSTFFSKNEFDYCINCAAYTNVEQAEESTELAFKINAEAVKHLATVCNEKNIILFHISTDYVFDGKKNTPYSETDITNPINQYGKSKLKGEQYIKEILKEHYIIRTSWLYSSFGKNFVKTIANKVKENADLKVTTSETGTPTSCIDLAKVIYELITVKKVPYGTYHFSNEGEGSWFDFAKQIAIQFKEYNLNQLQSVDFFKTKALRPKYSVLSKNKIKLHLKEPIKKWEKSVVEILSGKSLLNK